MSGASTLSDAVRMAIALFVATGDARSLANPGGVALLNGEDHLARSTEDAPPRIVFVETADGGALGGPLKISAGQVASVTEGLKCYAWGSSSATEWAGSTAYVAGRCVINGASAYRCITPGTSAASGGPAGSGAAITDGTCRWRYIAAADDFDAVRVDHARWLLIDLINAIKVVAPGMLEGAKLTRGIDADGEDYGAEYTLALTHTWPVPRVDRFWRVDITKLSPPDPDRPHGDTGEDVEVSTTVEPAEE